MEKREKIKSPMNWLKNEDAGARAQREQTRELGMGLQASNQTHRCPQLCPWPCTHTDLQARFLKAQPPGSLNLGTFTATSAPSRALGKFSCKPLGCAADASPRSSARILVWEAKLGDANCRHGKVRVLLTAARGPNPAPSLPSQHPQPTTSSSAPLQPGSQGFPTAPAPGKLLAPRGGGTANLSRAGVLLPRSVCFPKEPEL